MTHWPISSNIARLELSFKHVYGNINCHRILGFDFKTRNFGRNSRKDSGIVRELGKKGWSDILFFGGGLLSRKSVSELTSQIPNST